MHHLLVALDIGFNTTLAVAYIATLVVTLSPRATTPHTVILLSEIPKPQLVGLFLAQTMEQTL